LGIDGGHHAGFGDQISAVDDCLEHSIIYSPPSLSLSA
jgi:hypothetical protein